MCFELTNANDVVFFCVTEKQKKPRCGTVKQRDGMKYRRPAGTGRQTNKQGQHVWCEEVQKGDVARSHVHPRRRAIGRQRCGLTTLTQQGRRHRKFPALQYHCGLLTSKMCFYFEKVCLRRLKRTDSGSSRHLKYCRFDMEGCFQPARSLM